MPLMECPGCGGLLPLNDAQLRKRIECGRCGHVFRPGPAPPSSKPDHCPEDDAEDLASERACRLAVAGFVLSVIGLILSVAGLPICCPFVGVPFGVAGVILGRAGRESLDHQGYAKAAVVIGSIATILPVMATLAFAVAITLG